MDTTTIVLRNLLDIIHKHWSERKSEIEKYWDFYLGNMQKYLPRFEGEDVDDYIDRINDAVVENHCKQTCNVAVAYLYARGDKIQRRAEDERLQQLLKDRIWKTNHMWSFSLDRTLVQSVTGFSVVALEFVDSRTGSPFRSTAPKSELREYGTIRYRVLPSVDTMPLPRAEAPSELGGILRHYQSDNFSGLSAFDRLNYKEFKTYDVIEFIDDEVWLKWIDEKLEEEGAVNPFGDVRIPFVLFRNPGDPMALEGEPDHADAIPLNVDLNERLNDDRMVISHHSLPVIKFLRGAKMPSNWKRGPNSGLEFEGDGDAEYLTWDNVIEASLKRSDTLRQAITRVGGYSDISKGDTERIGQVRSGAGLRTLFLNDMLSTMMRQAYAQKGEMDLIRATARMWEYYTGEKFDSYESEVHFPEDFIGIDEWLRWQIDRDKMDAGILGPDEVLKKERADLITDQQIMDRLKKNRTLVRPTRQSRKEEEPDIKSMEQEL